MNPDSEFIESRLVTLELKATEAEDLLDQLNRTVFRQQQQIEWLARELVSLRQQLAPGDGAAPGPVVDERPPHY
jgi:SlyX protein